MKKLLYNISLLIAAAFVIYSCDHTTPEEPDDTPVEEPAETRTLTFVLPDIQVGPGEAVPSALKQKWVAGDRIVVHGEYAKDQVTVTLSSGDISADGKSATLSVDGLRPYKRDDCGSTLYASYPASAVDNLRHCFFYSAFKNENTQMLSACNSGDTFRFQNISSVVSFIVNGDFDSYAFTARKDIGINFDLFQVKITDSETNLRQYVQNPTPTIEINSVVPDGKTENFLYIPGGADLAGGFILRFFKDGKAVKGLTDKEAFTLSVDKVLDLGDITDLLVDAADDIDPSLATRIDTEGNANSYVMYSPGLYKFSAVKGNTAEVISGGDHAELLWETWCNTEEVTPRSVVAGVDYDEETGAMCFQIPDPVHPGNALIALLDAEDQILWSWHIWIPKDPITLISEDQYSTKSTMSRNLGALVDAVKDQAASSESFGLLYEWGRKDPFPGLGVASGAGAATIAGTDITYQETRMTLDEAISHPTAYVHTVNSWTPEATATSDDGVLWGETVKTVYDPCPVGYMLPQRLSTDFWKGTDMVTFEGFSYSVDNGYFAIGSLVFPLTGYIDNAGGEHKRAGECSLLWSGRWDSGTENGYGFNVDATTPTFKRSALKRTRGGSIRCVAE